MKNFVCINGRIVPDDKAMVPALDYGLLYGYGVFESMRSYSRNVFRLGEHLGRLRRSASMLGIKCDLTSIRRWVGLTLEANGLDDAYVRVMVTYGPGGPRLLFSGTGMPNVIVFAGRVPESVLEGCRDGVSAGFSAFRHYSQSPLNSIKTTNYIQAALRKKEAKKRRLGEVIVLNEKGDVVEASTSNIFMVGKDKTLLTPKTGDGCLPGITRNEVLEIAGKNGIKTIEKTIKPQELMKTCEIFTTNSVAGITPITRIENTKIRIGKTTRIIQQEYEKRVRTP